MSFIQPKDEMLHLTLMNGQARVLFCRTTRLSQEMARIHIPSDTACAALSRLMSGTLMLSVMMKGENDSVTVTVAGDGPIGKMTAVGRNFVAQQIIKVGIEAALGHQFALLRLQRS